MESLYLDRLPLELREHLIKFCDGKSLISLCSVSHDWRNFILNFSIPILKQWGRVVRNEIPSDFIIDILQSLYPNYWVPGVNCINWSDIYSNWYLWRGLRSNIDLNVSHFCNYNEVSCIVFSGVWLITGSREGFVEAHNCSTGERIEVIRKCGPIKSMYMRCSEADLEGCEMEGLEHNELCITTPNYHLTFDFKTKKTRQLGKMKNSLTLRHFENKIIEINVQVHNSVLRILCEGQGKTFTTFYDGVACNVLQMWNDKILLLFDTGHLQVLDFRLKAVKHPITQKVLNTHLLLQERQFYVFHLDVIIILGDVYSAEVTGRCIDIHVGNDCSTYLPLEEIGAEVTSVLYHAGILCFGCDEGSLVLYRVESDKELLSLNLARPLYQINVTRDSTKALTALALQEIPGERFVIGAASYKDLYLIHEGKVSPFRR